MSFAELKEKVAELTEEERLDLESWLVSLRLASDPKWLDEMDRRMAEMDAGKKVSQEEVMRIHQELLAKGQ